MSTKIYIALLLTLGFLSSKGQILGAEISPGGNGADSVYFTTVAYVQCLKPPTVNDTLIVEAIDSKSDTITNTFSPYQISTDTLGYDCARCVCIEDECAFPYIIKKTYRYRFKKGSVGLFGQCILTASFTPGKRVDSLSFIRLAQASKIKVQAQFNTCANIGVSDYQFSIPPVFYALNNEYYIHSPGFTRKLDQRDRYDSFAVEFGIPVTATDDTLDYGTGFNSKNPLLYNGHPNNNNTFPRGYHLHQETGDLRFTPTKKGHSLIKTRHNIYGNGQYKGFSEREFALDVIEEKPQSPPLLSGRSFSSFLNTANYHLNFCKNSTKSISFKISDLNNGNYLFPRVTIPEYLQPYISYQFNNDTLTFTGNLDTFLSQGREHRIFVQVMDSSCVVGSSSSYTLTVSNSRTPKATPKFDYLGKRKVELQSNPTDSFWAQSYAWRINGKTLSGVDTALTFDIPGDYKYVHISRGYNGCNDTVRGIYTTPLFPYIRLKLNSTIFCEGAILEIEPLYLNTTITPSVVWNDLINTNILKTTISQDSIYIAKATFSDSSISIDSISIKYLPAPSAEILVQDQHCESHQLKLSAYIDSTLHEDTFNRMAWYFNDTWIDSLEKIQLKGEGMVRLELVYANSCVAITSYDVAYTKFSNVPKSVFRTCDNDTLLISLSEDVFSQYDWSVKDSLWKKNSSKFDLIKPKINQPLSVLSTFSNDTLSCEFHDTLKIQILENERFSILKDSFFCANDSLIDLLDSNFIQPNTGIWIDSNAIKPISDSVFLDPSKGKQGQAFNKIYYQTKHPKTGCTYTRKVSLGVHALPKPWVADSIKLCIGGPTIILNDGVYCNPTSGLWSGPGVEKDSLLELFTFSPTLAGINSTNRIFYEISNDHCKVQELTIVTVNLKPDPIALRRSATAPGSIAFKDNRDDADSCIVDWWFWDFHDPFAPTCTTAVDDASFDGTKCRYSYRETPVHYYTISGTYDLTLVVKNTATGIQDERTREDHVNLLGTGFSEHWLGKIAIFPNPSDGGFTISSTEIIRAATYHVFNPIGQMIQSGNMSTSEQQVNIENAVPGIYLITVFDNQQRKLVAQSILVK